MELRFHPAALVELRSSADYYAARSAVAAARFALEVERTLEAVRAEPERFERVGREARAWRVDGFPYRLVYRVVVDVIWVVAVAHSARRPGYWTRRKID